MIIKKILESIDLNFARADEYSEQISQMDLSNDQFANIENIKTIDGFIYRFSKIQDMMGEKLFPVYLKAVEEYSPSMPLIDILNKLEKYEAAQRKLEAQRAELQRKQKRTSYGDPM